MSTDDDDFDTAMPMKNSWFAAAPEVGSVVPDGTCDDSSFSWLVTTVSLDVSDP